MCVSVCAYLSVCLYVHLCLCACYQCCLFYYRIIPPPQPLDDDPSVVQASSLPRSGGASGTGSNSSSSSTMPSRGSPATSPGASPKTATSRYRQKQQQVNGCVKKTSPLAKTKPDLTRIVQQRQSSPEIMMCTVSDAGVPTERQNRGEEEQELQSDIVQEHVEQRKGDELPSDENQSKLAVVEKTEAVLSFEVCSSNTSDVNTDTAIHAPPSTATIKPGIARRPKLPPKPSLPVTLKTDNTTPKATLRVKSLDSETVLKPPMPKPRAKTPFSDEGRYSCSPVFDNELDSKLIPPAKPPRRRSAQIHSSSDTPSPVASHGFFSATLPSAFAVEENREILKSPSPLPSQSKPALPPKPKRTSSSTSTVGLESLSLVVVAEHLNNDEIDLADIPYSTLVSYLNECPNVCAHTHTPIKLLSIKFYTVFPYWQHM